MKQPVKGSDKKAPGAKAPQAKVKRKTRVELDMEAWDRKRQKKNRGHAAGSRAQAGSNDAKKSDQVKQPDPRIGSKKPVELVVGDSAKPRTKPAKATKTAQPAVATLSPEQELALLENDDRLDALLERLDNGEALSSTDQQWVDSTLDRINTLMDMLGIEVGDDDDEEEEQQEDMLQLLKRNSSKDAF